MNIYRGYKAISVQRRPGKGDTRNKSYTHICPLPSLQYMSMLNPARTGRGLTNLERFWTLALRFSETAKKLKLKMAAQSATVLGTLFGAFIPCFVKFRLLRSRVYDLRAEGISRS